MSSGLRQLTATHGFEGTKWNHSELRDDHDLGRAPEQIAQFEGHRDASDAGADDDDLWHKHSSPLASAPRADF